MIVMKEEVYCIHSFLEAEGMPYHEDPHREVPRQDEQAERDLEGRSLYCVFHGKKEAKQANQA